MWYFTKYRWSLKFSDTEIFLSLKSELNYISWSCKCKINVNFCRKPCLCWYTLWKGKYPHFVLVIKIVEAEQGMFQKLYDLIRQELKCCEKLKESGNLSGSESQWHINSLAPFETIWLGAIRQQPITWASVDASLCRHIKSLGHNELYIYHDTI